MEGMVAAKKEFGVIENQLTYAGLHRSFAERSLRQWHGELTFLKKKYSLMERLLTLHHMHCQTARQKEEGESLRQECALFMNSVLADFEDKFNENLDSLECFKMLPESSTDLFLQRLHRLQQDWNNLQREHRQLELKLLNVLLKRFPVVIF